MTFTHQCNECGARFPILNSFGPDDTEGKASCPRCKQLFTVKVKDGKMRVLKPKKPKRVESFRERAETK